MADTTSARIRIGSPADIVTARHQGRVLAVQAGFSDTDLTVIATAISEVARNIIEYAGHGTITMRVTEEGNKQGIVVIARDEGPGIPDIDLALQDGYSTSKGLGLGLPGARRLMDEFEIKSQVRKGTTVIMKKWIR
jgi:serine/threonine-protein kinase RsbT